MHKQTWFNRIGCNLFRKVEGHSKDWKTIGFSQNYTTQFLAEDIFNIDPQLPIHRNKWRCGLLIGSVLTIKYRN